MYVISKIIHPLIDEEMWAVQIDHCRSHPDDEQWEIVKNVDHYDVIEIRGETCEQVIRRALVVIEALNRDEKSSC